MDIAGFNPPDYGLIDSNPVQFKTDLQAFFDRLAAHQDNAGDLQRVNDELHEALEGERTARSTLEQEAKQRAAEAEAARTEHNLTLAAYRQAVLNGDPTLPPDLVAGDSLEEVNASIDKARAAVAYVRDKVQNSPGAAGPPGQTATAATPPPRVPAGAPGRTIPDIDKMSPREKLVFGTNRSPLGQNT